jgi:hypothetical protein
MVLSNERNMATNFIYQTEQVRLRAGVWTEERVDQCLPACWTPQAHTEWTSHLAAGRGITDPQTLPRIWQKLITWLHAISQCCPRQRAARGNFKPPSTNKTDGFFNIVNIVTCLSDSRRGFVLDIGFIDYLQVVTTNNCNTIAISTQTLQNHFKPAVSSLVVAW